MMMLLGIFGVFIGVVAVLAMGQSATNKYIDRIRRERTRRQKLRTHLHELKKTLAELRETELLLSQQLGGDEHFSLPVEGEGGDLITGMARPKAQKTPEKFSSIVDVLLAERLLSHDDLAKAERYKLQSKSPYPIDEILPMLGYVSADVIQRVRRRYPSLG